jgi:hypothetical protein
MTTRTVRSCSLLRALSWKLSGRSLRSSGLSGSVSNSAISGWASSSSTGGRASRSRSRKVDQAAFGVGGPDPAHPGLFELVEHLQPASRIAGANDPNVAIIDGIAGGAGSAAGQTFENTAHFHRCQALARRLTSPGNGVDRRWFN